MVMPGGVVTEGMTAEEIEGLELMVVRQRGLPYPVFDADNHLYEPEDALTKFLPREYEGVIKYINVGNRTKIAFDNKITDMIPNPTFARVAPPGGQINDPQQRRSLASPEAFFDPEPRLRMMRELGIDRAMMFPTLAGLVEQRLNHDVPATHAVIHGYNEWLYEHWSFNYEESIFATPMISVSIVSEGIKELEYILERGACAFQFRSAPVPGLNGPRSFALPEFDPFWKLVEEADILVCMHGSDCGYDQYTNVWNGTLGREMRPFEGGPSPSFLRLSSEKNPMVDSIASIIGHGLATRFPKLRFVPTEVGTEWVPSLVERMQRSYDEAPVIFDEDPYEVFKRNIFLHCFHEKNPARLAELMGVDHVLFGSDFPHMEGLNDPLSYVEAVEDMSLEDQAKIMGGNLARLMKVDTSAH